MSHTTSREHFSLILERTINGLTEGALYALQHVCKESDLTPHLTVAGTWLCFLGTDHYGRIVYFDFAAVTDPKLLGALHRLQEPSLEGQPAPARILSKMN